MQIKGMQFWKLCATYKLKAADISDSRPFYKDCQVVDRPNSFKIVYAHQNIEFLKKHIKVC